LELLAKAQIQPILELAAGEATLFSGAAIRWAVTKHLSFGTWNRVSRGRSKTPKLMRKQRPLEPVESQPHNSEHGGRQTAAAAKDWLTSRAASGRSAARLRIVAGRVLE
jgi:hypothetical protein